MLHGHGDDLYQYPDIRINFSSNVYSHFNHEALFSYLSEQMSGVVNYPDPTPQRLEAELASVLSLRSEEVIVTNGATEAIYLIAQTFRGSMSYIYSPTFSEYADACRLHAHTIHHTTALDVVQSDSIHPRTLLWLCNPNNPTGSVIDKNTLLNIITSRSDVLYIIDASYAVFTREPLLTAAEASQLHNVLMLHSMTKEYAIPGLRLGFLTGNTTLLSFIRSQRMPWSVNRLAQDAGSYLLHHHSTYHLPLDTLLSEAKRVAVTLQEMGIKVYPSSTHILLCSIPSVNVALLKDRLAHSHYILIRDASNFEGLDASHFRIAVQMPEENDILLHALQKEMKDLLQKPDDTGTQPM